MQSISLDLLSVRYGCDKIHHRRICMSYFREGGYFGSSNPSWKGLRICIYSNLQKPNLPTKIPAYMPVEGVLNKANISQISDLIYQCWHYQNIKNLLVVAIVFGIHSNFFIVLPIRRKISRWNFFFIYIRTHSKHWACLRGFVARVRV